MTKQETYEYLTAHGVDYEVIENGIELKYGRSVAGSRDIARDFFDKLIQLPFRVPMESYRIRNYLQEQLKRIGFFARPHDYVTHIDEIETIFTLATRKNPRTMKSVLNMFQAMDLLDGKANDRPDYQLMELLLIVFQKCFPRIYLMLAERQSLNQWNSALHVEIPQEVIDFYGLNSPWKQRIYLMYQDDELYIASDEELEAEGYSVEDVPDDEYGTEAGNDYYDDYDEEEV